MSEAKKPVPLDLTEAFRGRDVMITGVTGFLGKVALVMLLDRYPEIGRVHVLVRPRSGGTADERFYNKVVTAEPFRPLRERYGDGFDAFIRSKCHPIAGDVTDPLFGIDGKILSELNGKLACVINSAGLVTFDPSLELAVSVNTEGAINAAALCKQTGAVLVHISTCFVAGTRRGPVFEDEAVIGSFPKQHDEDAHQESVSISVQSELKDVAGVVARLRAQADDTALAARFRGAAIKRLEEEGRDPKDEKALRLAQGRERKFWLSQKLVDAGMERAQAWGWPNTYTYTKALGEQAIAESGCEYSLVRPAIVESALEFPFPGWNEGFTTSAPLVFMVLKGHRAFPAGQKLVLDLIPVDMVAAGILGVAGAACAKRAQRVYQLASGDVNPFYVRRAVELCALYKRRFFKEGGAPNRSLMQKWFDEWLEPYPVPAGFYKLTSAPLFRKAAHGALSLLNKGIKGGLWGMPIASALAAQAGQSLETVDKQLAVLESTWAAFLPFIAGERFVFQCAHTRALWATFSPADREKLRWEPEKIDWRTYFLDVHMPGLEEWVFPGLEEERDKLKRQAPQSKDLLQLLNGAIEAYSTRTAFRFFAGEENQEALSRTRDDRITYAELGRFSDRAGTRLLYAGSKPSERVLLMSENRPEWPIAYFGALKAGCAVAPLDANLSLTEVINCAQAAEARFLLASPRVLERLGTLPEGLVGIALPELLRGVPANAANGGLTDVNGKSLPPLRKSAAADELASLLFTSGTTGKPKGVLLTHRNFASLAGKISNLFDLHVGEGVLSVLPMHHTFEFTCGLLVPLSLGAEITYLDELTADRLGEALETGRVHALIGVPALWQLLHRRLTLELATKPRLVEAAVQGAMALHGELRNRTSFNVGKLLFWPIHRKFGGNLRLLVSGGSALPDDVHEAFHQLGFDLTEGYGLTEAAPVLAVTIPENARRPGTVGPALPGVEIRIEDPNAEGVGEVIARGPNVMAGYLNDKDATARTVIDGWLHTGDLGKLSADGSLTLVGRKKDVILDASGKNVYPDELEELYGANKDDVALITELCVVGLPDGKGHERIACVAVVREPKEGESREGLRARAEQHFADISSGLPFWKRIKILHFWDKPLPKTSTRKIKRPQVLEELVRLERAAEVGSKLKAGESRGGDSWLYDLLAELVQKPLGSVHAGTRLIADLGFDSLLMAELVVALEKAGHKSPDEARLASLGTAKDLIAALGDTSAHHQPRISVDDDGERQSEEIAVPDSVAAAGRAAIDFAQKALFNGLFEIEITGKGLVPRHAPFLVAANHSSHLDVGLVKLALGEEGEKLASLAARDYFFDNPWKRAWFGNFTNLVPLDRKGSLKESLRNAGRTLELGYHLLIFPEGTRSSDGKLQEFKPAIGYLSLMTGADILPVYIDGAFDAMPKGAFVPDPRKRKKLLVRVGPPLLVKELREATRGMSRSGAHREITRLVQLAVEALRDGLPAPKIEPRVVELKPALAAPSNLDESEAP